MGDMLTLETIVQEMFKLRVPNQDKIRHFVNEENETEMVQWVEHSLLGGAGDETSEVEMTWQVEAGTENQHTGIPPRAVEETSRLHSRDSPGPGHHPAGCGVPPGGGGDIGGRDSAPGGGGGCGGVGHTTRGCPDVGLAGQNIGAVDCKEKRMEVRCVDGIQVILIGDRRASVSIERKTWSGHKAAWQYVYMDAPY